MKKYILALPVILFAGVLTLRFLSPNQSVSSQTPAQIKKELPKAKEGAHPIEKCLLPRAKYRETFAEFGEYKMVAYEFDFDQAHPEWTKTMPMKDNHIGHRGYLEPNLAIGVIKNDPLSGCTPVVRSLRGEPMPFEWGEKQRTSVKKLYWVYMGKELETKYDISLQEWILERTSAPMPHALDLTDDDIRALNSLKVKLQPWHVVGASSADRLDRRVPAKKP